MKKRLSLLVLTIILPLLLLLGFFQAPRAAQTQTVTSDKLDSALAEVLASDSGEPVRFLIYLKGRASFSDHPAEAIDERRRSIVRELQEMARQSQQPLLEQLSRWKGSGDVLNYTPLWIVNAVAVEATPNIVSTIAKQPNVERLTLDAAIQFVEPVTRTAQAAPRTIPWNIERTRARHVWEGLGITGSGVTVAIMDTGVDWLHEALDNNYRGQEGPNINHEGNWLDLVNETNVAPLDPNGHGTHVAGTAVGQNGIGIAPGAQWIAVRVFDEHGMSTLSRVHLAFQWLLAPAGDPTRAPDIVNGSWGSSVPILDFLPDIQALHRAGIVTVFAAGNSGPESATINSPASYTGTIAVGASDDWDDITWFSSRGPSSHTSSAKPELAAPGALVLSSLPANQYGIYHGTSMATPHVSGAAALLLSANPQLIRSSVIFALTSTTRLIDEPRPNPDAGWGRLDAYAAVATQSGKGTLRGFVHADGEPIPKAAITVTTPAGRALPFITDEAGRFTAWLQPGQYRLQASAFGYQSVADVPVNVAAGVTDGDISMTALPAGTVTGRVQSASNSGPLTATIYVDTTPIQVNTDESGYFEIQLPAGRTYPLRAERTGFKVGEATVTVEQDHVLVQDFKLEPSLSILLVDSGRWYYASYIDAYRQTLRGLNYAYDEWIVRGQFQAPTFDTLNAYDLVIWSAPYDSPGRINGGVALAHYLNEGGQLLISGQNLASFDSAGFRFQEWFYSQLRADYLGNASPPYTITGEIETEFAGGTYQLNGADSAGNQSGPDLVKPRKNSLTQSILKYHDGASAGLHAGWCEPFEIVYFGFGLEGVAGQDARVDLLQRSIRTFSAPPIATGLHFQPSVIDGLVLPGTTVSYTLSLRNLSEVHTTTVQLAQNSEWQSTLSESTVQLGPCEERSVTVSLHVPSNLPRNTEHTLHVQASSDHGLQRAVTIHSKTPGQILLVDDDRWYDQKAVYGDALQQLGLSYDVWDTNQLNSPTLTFLQAYDMVLWYTAYDWFMPITQEEEFILYNYLEQGGRLFLTSQDYLYHHGDAALTKYFLGVLDYAETFTSTATIGGEDTVIGDPAGPFRLSYGTYQNFSDGLVRGPESQVYLWHDRGMAAGLATPGDGWRSIFWSIPLETLPVANHAKALGSIVSWLGDLGDSTFTVTPRIGSSSNARTYTLTVRNLPQATVNSVTLTSTIPFGLDVNQSTLGGGAVYDPATRQITWQGTLQPGTEHEIVYQASVNESVSLAARLDSTVRVSYERHGIVMERVVPTWVDAPDLRTSRLQLSPTVLKSGQVVTFTATLVNRGTSLGQPINATLHLPPAMKPLSDTLTISRGEVQIYRHRIVWRGHLAPNEAVQFSIRAEVDPTLAARYLPSGLVVDDGMTAPIVRDATLYLLPYQAFMPITARGASVR